MRQFQRWLYLLTACVFVVSSCSPRSSVNTDTSGVGEEVSKVNAFVNSVLQQDPKLENNECLNCHSDKDLLIETAKPEEVVESESKGVG